MNKKILALGLGILTVLIAGGYGIFYVYESLYVVSEDLKIFKDELNSVESGIIPESDIKEMETLANQVENSPSMKNIPLQERKKIANDIRKDPFYFSTNSSIGELNSNFTNCRELASRYDLLLKGDVAKDIRSVYSTQMMTLTQNMRITAERIPTDVENGDNAAFARDCREIAKLSRELNAIAIQDKIKLQNIINSIGG
jgi:hypothetical protein